MTARLIPPAMRAILPSTLLLLAAVAFAAPHASASIDNVWVCKGDLKDSPCDNNDVLYVNVKQEHVGVCVIGVSGSCDPYDGDLARVDVNGQTYAVPDPCYTTACF
jgi:hypothetical protein